MCHYCLIEKIQRTRTIGIFILSVFCIPVILSFFIAPSMGWYRTHNPRQTKMMKYRKSANSQYTFVSLKNISPYLINGVIFAEDGDFYTNQGVDLEALRNSFFVNMHKHKLALGGSTITMQLCKNLFLSPKKTYFRKYLEIILASRMHKALSKQRILEIYLNVIEWGPNIWGAENAAQYYFHKPASDLTIDESVTLASIISRPLKYHPGEPNPYFEDRAIPIRMNLEYLYGPTANHAVIYGPTKTEEIHEAAP